MPTSAVSYTVVWAIGVPQLVRFIDYDEVPLDLAQLILKLGRIVIGKNYDPLLRQRERNAFSFHFAIGSRVNYDRWQIKFICQLCCPLLADELLSNLVFEGCWSCGDLVGVCGFDSVFERDACDDFREVVKAA